MLTKKEQEILTILFSLKRSGIVSDFVPKIFSYHSSFYRSIKKCLCLIKCSKDSEGINKYSLTFEGFMIANFLNDYEILRGKQK